MASKFINQLKEKKSYPGPVKGPCFHVLPHESSRKLVIFFSAKDMAPHKFNFWQIGRELPANLLFVNNGRNEWYQDGIPDFGNTLDETITSIKDWQTALNIKESYTIGTSMGAYAAIHYGMLLDAYILAFSPDVVLGDSHTRSAKYASKHIKPACSDLRDIIKPTKKKISIFIGEDDAGDVRSASLLSDSAQVEIVSLRGVDHYVPSFLARDSHLITLLNRFIANKPLPLLPNQGGALAKKEYPTNLFASYHASKEQCWEECEERAKAALEVYPYGEAALNLLGMAQLKLEKTQQAVDSFAHACLMAPGNAEYRFHYSNALRVSGARDAAQYVLRQLLKQWPGHARAHYALGMILLEKGDQGSAKRHLQTALKLEPKNEAFQHRMRVFKAKAKKEAIEEKRPA